MMQPRSLNVSVAGPENAFVLLYFLVTLSCKQETGTFSEPLYRKLQFSNRTPGKAFDLKSPAGNNGKETETSLSQLLKATTGHLQES